ncbi:protein JASON-like isoform X2 [Magnolia sinica]|uniref:protein JASON-like isoform X2 n=1 Tax=Magnolia sinica TaxID=86752 RepID=UPI00265A807E|nr:protein JASON-like isoform X2 [Magnolia sinica]
MGRSLILFPLPLLPKSGNLWYQTTDLHLCFHVKAKFLKSCGTLVETPAEIRKASERMRVLPHDGNDVSSNFRSWLPGSSGKRLLWDEQPDHVPISPVKLTDEGKTSVLESSGSPEHKSRSRMPEQQMQTRMKHMESPDGIGLESVETTIGIPIHLHNKDNLPSVTPELPIVSTQCKKCVRFECDPSESDTHSCKGLDSLGSHDRNGRLLGQQQSPYPTPLRLTEEMQTPGTVFPVELENLATGKNARIRSQYVYPVLNTVENSSQWNALKGSDAGELGSSGEAFELCKHASSDCLAKTPMNYRATADGLVQNEHNSMLVDASLAQWLKPGLAHDERGHKHLTFSNGKSPSGRSPDNDRPILGTVAAHWNDEPIHVSPKWWDGNGIPNSTNKYKEDQKVSWHATPFEERLEKALSDERLFPQRNLNGKPIDFDDSEESDTAASYFQASNHLNQAMQS